MSTLHIKEVEQRIHQEYLLSLKLKQSLSDFSVSKVNYNVKLELLERKLTRLKRIILKAKEEGWDLFNIQDPLLKAKFEILSEDGTGTEEAISLIKEHLTYLTNLEVDYSKRITELEVLIFKANVKLDNLRLRNDLNAVRGSSLDFNSFQELTELEALSDAILKKEAELQAKEEVRAEDNWKENYKREQDKSVFIRQVLSEAAE